jgi:hypothetical protein
MEMIEIIEERPKTADAKVTVEEVNRVLEVGRIHFSVLTDEEIQELTELLSSKEKIGNTGVS